MYGVSMSCSVLLVSQSFIYQSKKTLRYRVFIQGSACPQHTFAQQINICHTKQSFQCSRSTSSYHAWFSCQSSDLYSLDLQASHYKSLLGTRVWKDGGEKLRCHLRCTVFLFDYCQSKHYLWGMRAHQKATFWLTPTQQNKAFGGSYLFFSFTGKPWSLLACSAKAADKASYCLMLHVLSYSSALRGVIEVILNILLSL